MSGDVSSGTTMGLMYGRYKTNWGWYVTATGEWGTYTDYSYGEDADKKSGGFAVPVELGVQWNYKKVNIGFGFQYAIDTGDVGAASDYKYFFGVGYNF